MKKNERKGLLKVLISVFATGAVLSFFLAALSNLKKESGAEGKAQLEQAIKRGAVTCYATEGIYPPDLEYLKEHYGLRVDESRYTVIYEVFAENLMPDITVLEKDYEE